MNNVLTYKRFIGSVHFSAKDNVFFGKMEDISEHTPYPRKENVVTYCEISSYSYSLFSLL
jgi:hypothetical protein